MNPVTRTGLSSIHFFSPTQLPSGFWSAASLSTNSTRQSWATPCGSVIAG